jgi:hypothetical protein
VTPCSVVRKARRFGGTCCLYFYTHTHTHTRGYFVFIQILAFWFLVFATFSLSFSPLLLCFTFSFNTISPYLYDRFTVPLIFVLSTFLVFPLLSLITLHAVFHAVAQLVETALQVGRSRVRFPLVSFGILHWYNPPGRTMALGLTQPLTQMSTSNISWGENAVGA